MKEISSGLRIWLLFLAILSLISGLASINAQGLLFSLYSTTPFEPELLRVLGAVNLAIGFLLYKAAAIRKVDFVKPILLYIIVCSVLVSLAVVVNHFVGGIYGARAYYLIELQYTLIALISLLFYRKM